MPTKDAMNTDPAPKTVNVVLDLFVRTRLEVEPGRLVCWLENTNPTHMNQKGETLDALEENISVLQVPNAVLD